MKVNKRILTMIIGILMIGSMAVGCEKKEEVILVKDDDTTYQVAKVDKDPVVEEINKIVYDKNDIKITCTTMEKQQGLIPTTSLTLKIENNRDEDVIVQNDMEVTINDGVVVNNSFSEDLSANETKDLELVFSDEYDFKENGIEGLEKMKINLMVLHNEYHILTEDVITLDLNDK